MLILLENYVTNNVLENTNKRFLPTVAFQIGRKGKTYLLISVGNCHIAI